MSEYPWYGLVQGDHLEQGDFLVGCSMLRPMADGSIRRDTADVVILSQSCDLAQDKLELIQVCPYWPLPVLAAQIEYFGSKRGCEDLRRGNVPGFHLLNCCTLAGFETDYLICDFRSLFGIHFVTAKAMAAAQASRLRLLPPYREHLAQAFARFFMRVGLPEDVPAFR